MNASRSVSAWRKRAEQGSVARSNAMRTSLDWLKAYGSGPAFLPRSSLLGELLVVLLDGTAKCRRHLVGTGQRQLVVLVAELLSKVEIQLLEARDSCRSQLFERFWIREEAI